MLIRFGSLLSNYQLVTPSIINVCTQQLSTLSWKQRKIYMLRNNINIEIFLFLQDYP